MSFKDSPISYIAIIAVVFILIYYIGLNFNITLPQTLIIIVIFAIGYLLYSKYYKKE